MTLGIRKVVVVGAVGAVFLLANVLFVAHWMEKMGWSEWARHVRSEFLTGTAITVILALLILLVPGRSSDSKSGWFGRCPTCDHLLLSRGKYCAECGSKT